MSNTKTREIQKSEQRVALITGSAAPRVGRVIAEKLAALGYQIAIHSNSSRYEGERFAEELNAAGTKAIAYQANLKNETECRQLVQNVRSAFERIDVVVNSAAIWQPIPFEKVTGDDLNEYFRINLAGSFFVAQEAGLIMVGQEDGGVIINIGDWSPVRPYVDYAAYFLSKGSIPTMTRSLAVELATRNPNIRVNAVLPGPVVIPKNIDTQKRNEIINATLLKREGSPENVADACICLIENDFITGVTLPVDGGRSIYSPYNPV